MTPFKIRERLKTLVNGPKSTSDEKYTVTFVLPDGSERVVRSEPGYTVLMAADVNGLTIDTGRRAGGACPDGLCDMCRVEIVNSTGLSPMADIEARSMDDSSAGMPHEGRPRHAAPKRGPNTRLGCHCKIKGDGAKIRIVKLFDPSSIKGTETEV